MRASRPNPARMVATLAAMTLLCTATTQAMAATTKIDIETVPPGAEVFMVAAEGGETRLGETPLQAHRVPRGQIALRFRKDGFKDLVETLDIGKRPSRFVFKLVAEVRPATLAFTGAAAVHGAAISIDGKAQGQLPGTVSVTPGRHLAVVTKDGYERWEKWLDLTDGQTLSFDIELVPAAESLGSILASSTPAGAAVSVDGVARGTSPVVIDGLKTGVYLVQFALAGHAPHEIKATVTAGQRALANASLTAVADRTGSIKVLVDVEGAKISLDGEPAQPAPFGREGLAPGVHLVEASAAEHTPVRRDVTVRAGETSVVRMALGEATQKRPASVRVVSNAPGAVASVDGGATTPVPGVLEISTAGTHFVTVTAPGYSKWTKQITTSPGQTQELVAELSQTGQLLVEVESGAQAEIFVSGKLAGMTPLRHDLQAGPYEVTAKRADAEPDTHAVTITVDTPTSIVAFAKDDAPADAIRAMPFSAQSISPGLGSLDIVFGWPYAIEMRMNGGLTEYMDLGFTFRNMADTISEFEGRFKFLLARSPALGIAVEVGIGGGAGSNDRDSFIFRSLALGSLFIGEKVALTGRVGFLVFSDHLAKEGANAETTLAPSLPSDDRDSGIEFHAGLTVEFAVSDEWNFFVLLDGMPFRSGSHHYIGPDGNVDLPGRLLFNEGFAPDAKRQQFRAGIGASLLF